VSAQRYAITLNHGELTLSDSPNGKFVSHRDYAELESELARLRSAKSGWTHVKDGLPAPGQPIVCCNHGNGVWQEVFDPHEPLGSMTHWIAAPLKVIRIDAAELATTGPAK
jgi:hypothetical protein